MGSLFCRRNHKVGQWALRVTACLLSAAALTGCRVSDPFAGTTDGEGSSKRPAVTEKPKTPTPQLEFDSNQFVRPPLDRPDPEPPQPGNGPKYAVDVLADPKLVGYSSLSGLFGELLEAPDSFLDEENSGNLFDGYESSKYCLPYGDDGTVTVVWSMCRALPVSAYALVTGNDSESYPDRNPAAWELYGSADGSSDSYELVHSVDDAELLPAANYAYSGMILDQTVEYQFFKIVFHAKKAASALQLGELRLYTANPAKAGLAEAACPKGALSLQGMIDRFSVVGSADSDNHPVGCLFDNIVETGEGGSNKYCIGGNSVSVEWSMNDPVRITDYVIYTANDTETYPERNPIAWKLYGKGDGGWELIVEVTDGELPVKNYTPTTFTTGAEKAYSNYRMVIECARTADCLQLSEISLFTREDD